MQYVLAVPAGAEARLEEYLKKTGGRVSEITNEILAAFAEEAEEEEHGRVRVVSRRRGRARRAGRGRAGRGRARSEDEEEEDLVGESEEEEPEEEEVAAYDDPVIQSFLAKYGGDVEKALRGAAELTVVLGRQGGEKSAALARVQELEQQLAQLQAFSGLEDSYLTEEQTQWVEEAVGFAEPARLRPLGAAGRGVRPGALRSCANGHARTRTRRCAPGSSSTRRSSRPSSNTRPPRSRSTRSCCSTCSPRTTRR